MWQASGKIVNDQAIIRVGIKQFLPQAPSVRPVSSAVQYPVSSYFGLIDTGAQMSSITRKAISEMDLISHGKRMVMGSGGTWEHKRYCFYLGVFCRAQHRPESETYYQLADPQDAVDIDDNARFDVIIGMDILKRCDMSFHRSGEFSITIYN